MLRKAAACLALGFAAVAAGAMAADDDSQALTYNRDIAPIFQASCQECHHAGTTAPMTFMSYDEVRPWVKSIRQAVADKTMPPWHADPAHGNFKNDIRLSPENQEKILAWIAQGAAPGDAKDHPPARKFESDWVIGQPDHIFYLPEEYTVPATMIDEYKYFNVVADLPEDVWLQAIECKPGNPAIVHHIIATPLGGWAPGMPPAIFEAPYGRLLKKGTQITVQMHYHNTTGQDHKDRSMIGIKFAKYPVEKQVRTEGIANWAFRIPANAESHPVSATYEFTQDAAIRSVMPHMHLRGNSMKYTAKFPDGREEVLLSVPKYSFDWQMVYEFAKPVKAPKGTKILVDATFDNSTKNPDNPDPNVEVKPGQPTTDEMMIGWMYYTLDEENVAAGKMIEAERRGPGSGRGRGQVNLVEMVKRFDKNGDGLLQKDEAPERMKQYFDVMDLSGDGAVDEGEAKEAQKSFGGGNRQSGAAEGSAEKPADKPATPGEGAASSGGGE